VSQPFRAGLTFVGAPLALNGSVLWRWVDSC
jgi:hypothetical protein